MYEYHLFTTSLLTESVTQTLEDLGALAITWQDAQADAIYEPAPGEVVIWPDVTIKAIFDDSLGQEMIATALRTMQDEQRIHAFQLHQLEDRDWVRENLQDFQPLQFANKLWVNPSWQPLQHPNAINIVLDPGLAFGTGSHPTTALCLTWLAENISGREVIIDYGCGSGILAIAALKLGAKSCLAIDYDEQALLACRENAALNQIDVQALNILLPTDLPAKIEVDIIIANILANTIIGLIPTFAQSLKSKGKLVLSGILTEQTQAVLAALEQQFTNIIVTEQENWVCISCEKT